jgi:hypothetical protein
MEELRLLMARLGYELFVVQEGEYYIIMKYKNECSFVFFELVEEKYKATIQLANKTHSINNIPIDGIARTIGMLENTLRDYEQEKANG